MTAGVPALESTGFGSGRIVVKYNPEYPEKKVYDRQYFITDHLGSVRVVFDQSGEVIARNDYYPFGKQHDNPALTVPNNPADNRFLFNGKEKQLTGGLNLIDYGWRMYDPEVARWFNIDPLAEKYYPVSPYVFTLNSPVRFIDPFGMDVWEINEDGSIASRTEDKTQDAFHMVGSDGARIDGQSITFDYGTITGAKSGQASKKDADGNIVAKESFTLFEVKGDDNATKLFEFMANPGKTTNVEWSHVKIGTEKSQKNVVGTSHHEEKTRIGGYMQQMGVQIRESNHNHPSGQTGPSLTDINAAEKLESKYPNATTNIYTANPSTYTPYDKSTFPAAAKIPDVIISGSMSK